MRRPGAAKTVVRVFKTVAVLAGLPVLLATMAMQSGGPSMNAKNVSTSQAGDPSAGTELATLGGGCFWCLEAAFERIQGVQSVTSGYAGGTDPHPTYQAVCTGHTGHAEVIQIAFDPAQISYADLLRIFFAIHDPTTLDRQGADVGSQYRSIILTHDDHQREVAESMIRHLEEAGIWKGIVTQVEPLQAFYPAEGYHQDYYAKNPNQAYCRLVINPKLRKLEEKFTAELK
jgi:peptide-methionine (S)-S-oxide reductase